MVGGVGVVQHDEHPPFRDQAPVEVGTAIEVCGLAAAVDAEGIEEPAEHVDRMCRLPAGAETAQVYEQLPVGEPVEVAVGPGQR